MSDFSQAVKWMKEGKKVRRSLTWYMYLDNAYSLSTPTS